MTMEGSDVLPWTNNRLRWEEGGGGGGGDTFPDI